MGGGGDRGEGGGFELNLRHGAKRGDRGGTVRKGGGGRDTCTRYQIKRKHFAHEEKTVNGGGGRGVVSLGGAIRSILNGTEGYIFEGRRDIFCEEEYYKQLLDTLHTQHNLAGTLSSQISRSSKSESQNDAVQNLAWLHPQRRTPQCFSQGVQWTSRVVAD